MIVVVGGQARKVGKTRAMCDIIAATRELAWTAAKISAHGHGAPEPGHLTDTERYLAAGAAEAMLLHSPAELPTARNLIIESNAAMDALKPDLFVFVTDSTSPEWKESARFVRRRADIQVDRRIDAATLRRIADKLSPA
jgi:hypothetical protein